MVYWLEVVSIGITVRWCLSQRLPGSGRSKHLGMILILVIYVILPLFQHTKKLRLSQHHIEMLKINLVFITILAVDNVNIYNLH